MSMTNSSSTLVIQLDMYQKTLIRYIYPVWLSFGLIGCLLNLVVFSRRKLRNITCSIYFSVASVDHLFTLIIGLGPVLYSLNHPDPLTNYLWFCRLRGFLFQICLMISRWCMAFACINRCVLSFEQTYLRSFVTIKVTYRVIIISALFWTIVSVHRLFFFEIGEKSCWILTNVAAGLFQSIYVIIGGGFLPSLIMTVSACLIRRKIQQKNKRRVQWVATALRRHRMDRQIHRLLFIQIIFYIIFILPQMANVVFNTFSITLPNRSSEYFAIERFINFFAEFMLYLFPVTSFYLYTLTSRTFRSELMKFLQKIMKRTSRVRPTIGRSTITAREPE